MYRAFVTINSAVIKNLLFAYGGPLSNILPDASSNKYRAYSTKDTPAMVSVISIE